MPLRRGIQLAILLFISKEESLNTIMAILLALICFNAQAGDFPSPDTTPLYFCQNELLQGHIFRKAEGQTVILMEEISAGQAPTPWFEENVSEVTNKTQTVYTSEDLILKIIRNDSGFMPGTVLISKNGNTTPFDLSCQLMYKIKEDASQVLSLDF